MATPGPRLDALKALLSSAQELAQTLEADATLRRVLRALASIPPDDRNTIARALERAAASRRVNEAFARLNGIRMHVNPNPRLYVRVVDAEPSTSIDAVEQDDIVPDIFLLMRRVPMLVAPAGRAVWEPALRAAAALLTPAQRETCVRFVDDVRSFLVADDAATAVGGSTPDSEEQAS
jgi:hypothetical protein